MDEGYVNRRNVRSTRLQSLSFQDHMLHFLFSSDIQVTHREGSKRYVRISSRAREQTDHALDSTILFSGMIQLSTTSRLINLL